MSCDTYAQPVVVRTPIGDLTFTYNVDQSINTITDSAKGIVKTFTYNGDGTIQKIAATAAP